MDPISVTTITFGLKVLQELGMSTSCVFSPILLLLSVIGDKRSIKKYGIDKDQIPLIRKVSQNGFNFIEHFNPQNPSLTVTWKYRYAKNEDRMKFHSVNGSLLHLNYVSQDSNLRDFLVSENQGFRASSDEMFKIMEIPLIGGSLRFVIFLPQKKQNLEKSFMKLDADRMNTLFDDLNVFQLDYAIPFFKANYSMNSGKILGLKSSKTHKFEFNWRRPAVNVKEDGDDSSVGFLKLSHRDPYYFFTNRPFIYAVFKNETLPIVMGFYNGND
uniref:SERPIN domain-containing protein n=1 Tax=Caenorhabditis tropicalis TaxID=1561998 RepID=A0A1I7TAP8_9PELO